jgi:hypothetical protein
MRNCNFDYDSLFNTTQESKNCFLDQYLEEFEKAFKGEKDYSLLNNQTEENIINPYYAIEKPMKKREILESNKNPTFINDNPLTNSGNSSLSINKEEIIDQTFNSLNLSKNHYNIENNISVKEDKVEQNSNYSDANNNIINESDESNESDENNESNKNNESNEIISSSTSKFLFKTWTEKRKEYIIKAINPFMLNKVIIAYANELIKNHNIDDENKRIKKEKLVGLKREYTANTQVEYTKLLLKTEIKEIIGGPISGKCKKKEKDYNKKIIQKYYDKNPVEEIQKLFNTEFQDFFYYIMAPNDPNDPIRTRIKKIYEEQLKKKIEKNRKTIKENIENFVEMINDRKGKGTK